MVAERRAAKEVGNEEEYNRISNLLQANDFEFVQHNGLIQVDANGAMREYSIKILQEEAAAKAAEERKSIPSKTEDNSDN